MASSSRCAAGAGFRLHSEADALRVRRMQAHLTRGLSAAEAARAVLGQDGRADAGPPGLAAGISCLAAPTGPGPAGRIRQVGEAGSGGVASSSGPACTWPRLGFVESSFRGKP